MRVGMCARQGGRSVTCILKTEKTLQKRYEPQYGNCNVCPDLLSDNSFKQLNPFTMLILSQGTFGSPLVLHVHLFVGSSARKERRDPHDSAWSRGLDR